MKIKIKNILTTAIIISLIFGLSIAPALGAEPDIEIINVTYSNGTVNVNGTVGEGILALAILVCHEEGTLIRLETTGITGSKTFRAGIPVSLVPGNYILKVAKYEGGDFIETTFTVVAPPRGGGASSTDKGIPEAGATATTVVASTVDSGGKAKAEVTTGQINDAIKQALDATGKTGEKPVIEIKVEAAENIKSTDVIVPKAALDSIIKWDIATLSITGPVANISLDSISLEGLGKATTADISFFAGKAGTEGLSAEAKALIGQYPVYEFKVTGGGKEISQFTGNVTVAIPYKPGPGEDPDAIIIRYVDSKGELSVITNGRYDEKAGKVIFTTNHFSKYAVGYNKVAFKDVDENAWYEKAVTFVAARNVTSGIEEGKYGPGLNITRGQFITMLMRTYGIEPDIVSAGGQVDVNNFADAGNTYYTGYLSAAKSLGITSGVGDNMFAPNRAITRQEMFTMVYRVLEKIDRLPEKEKIKGLADFYDSNAISPYAREAIEYLVKTGTISGSEGKLNPWGKTTRAEMAQVLYSLMLKW